METRDYAFEKADRNVHDSVRKWLYRTRKRIFFTTEITFRTTVTGVRTVLDFLNQAWRALSFISGLVKGKRRKSDLLSRIIVRYLSLFVRTDDVRARQGCSGGKNAKSTETSKRVIKRLRGHWKLKISTLFIFSQILWSMCTNKYLLHLDFSAYLLFFCVIRNCNPKIDYIKFFYFKFLNSNPWR